MDFLPLLPFLSVSPQIGTSDAEMLVTQGFQAARYNRRDGEGEGQPTSTEVEAAARRLGLDCRHIPLTPSQGCGSCLFPAERGGIVLAQFVDEGRPSRAFPSRLIACTRPTRRGRSGTGGR